VRNIVGGPNTVYTYMEHLAALGGHLPPGAAIAQELKLLEELGCIAQGNMRTFQEIESPSW
jgi:hypothetical protein